ncbi:MAG: tRNA (adenosine(37)-N6)-threonylcarbamoyltransferase complex ATPase subunit type 1 TsaE [Candidatus Shapirobacteria bacterium]|nr:tRNA (adenosine(37)-N6)-threonylcarbamoyltransferase complex ATPase subunit type 1 TsaE [Candidatus Shapirobacteria bacterium]
MDYFTESAQETTALGQKIGFNLKPGTTVALFGDLGGGKTTFLQGLALGLGVKERILSPTFVISRDYPLSSGGRFYHFDWYRLENEKQAQALGIEELFGGGNIVAIEWADRAKKILPQKRIEVYFKQGEKDLERKITVLEKN